MSKINFKEGVNLNEGVKIGNGVDFKKIETISAKNTPKASQWSRPAHYDKVSSPKENKANLYSEYTPRSFNKWTTIAILPEGYASPSVSGTKKSNLYSQKMNLFKASSYSRRCVVRVGFTKPGQIFSNAGKMHKFLEDNNVGTEAYNGGLVRYVSRADATLERKPIWDNATEVESLFTCSSDGAVRRVTPDEATELLGDCPVFKIFVSPEDPGVDFNFFCICLINKLKAKLQYDVKWCASNHYNTEHPHVHILCSRLTDDGRLLRLPSNYIKNGLRKDAEAILTTMMGPVSWEKELEKINKAVRAKRFCDIDKRILAIARTNPADPTRIPAHRLVKSNSRLYLQISKRLQMLNQKGLVAYEKYDKEDPLKKESCWVVSKTFETEVRKAEFAEELEMDVSGYVLDKGHKSYKCSLIKAKRIEEDSSRVLLALIDENGVKHLREENLDAELECPIGPVGGVFELKELKEMLEQRSRELDD